MKIKLLLSGIFMMLYILPIYTQNTNIDSLWQIIQKGEITLQKHIDIIHIIAENESDERDAVIEVLHNIQSNTKLEKAQRDAILGRVLFLQSQFAKATKATEESITALKKMDDSEELIKQLKIDNLINLGNIKSSQSEFETAIDYFLAALDMISVEQNPDTAFEIYSKIGYVYDKFEERDVAEIHFGKALNIALKYQLKHKTARAYLGLGQMASNLYELERADSLYEIGLRYIDTVQQPAQYYSIYCSQAMVKEKKKEFDTAIPMFMECLKFYENQNNKIESADMNLHLGYIARVREQYKESAYHCQLAHDQFHELGYNLHKMYACGCLGTSYYGLKDYKKAFIYNDNHWQLFDSLQAEESQVRVTQEIAEAERKRDQKLYNEQLKRRNSILVLLGVFTLAALVAYRIKIRDNQKISQQNAQLEQLNQTKDRIFGIIGHDLRKPALSFRGISRKVDFLIQQKEYNTLSKLGASIDEEATQLNALIDNLLKWALVQREVLPNDLHETAIAPIAEELSELFAKVISEKNIQFRTDIDPTHQVLADYNALTTILRNLLDNAIKYTPGGGTITLSTEQVKNGINITVQDTGVGIPADKINSIFLLQKDKSTRGTKGEKGTGLGLYLVGELIKQIQGTVTVNSQIGKGTKFSITLPQAS